MLSSTSILSLLAFTGTALSAPSHVSKSGLKVYTAGDSTMAKGSGAITGWGVYLPYSLSVPVVNKAMGGRSSRSYTVEGRFDDIANLVQPGDIVIMEFGHNDGGSLSPKDNGRTVCPGRGSEVCKVTSGGKNITVHTYSYYLTEAGKDLIKKGAKVIISSPTPNNPWEGGTFSYTDGGRFVEYSRDVAKALGPNAMYVNHSAYTAAIFKELGKEKTDALFPKDHTHTSPKGADVVAKAFVKGLQCGGGGFLKGYVKNATETIDGSCI
ncbi:hypothetical protein IAQ61_002778 [Plenodomus lingam]|uniref:Similar to secreted rhamnogalacturonan acetylesterase n=1 Tax=Leptosphaeria maculans (strain JN3 / isolate v23.1.3 / race Av1-4-5-6-7-8) TaxID=985895 RepID=E5A8R4_LEPMJ|nr:similar to secreted rhamnogalacturonan acetylesterase [Plenodomus lingam JN3]KAH9877412.1 hypothetical protein IAQ61_002778 [Plenodomus lingam]CBY00009.1 similar to secreted rhamnogalacturonan acetylesterase [Plenodomus lingam JN3]